MIDVIEISSLVKTSVIAVIVISSLVKTNVFAVIEKAATKRTLKVFSLPLKYDFQKGSLKVTC